MPTLVGRYQIVEPIREGGMGVLYLARDPAIDRPVAIKLLRSELEDEEARQRFAREWRAAGRLQHPFIVTIFDVGEHEGRPFIAMEYVRGETFGELIDRRAPISLPRKLLLIDDLCDALAYAHRAGIVHRDIKPSNVMVDVDGVLKVLDFGIARIAESSLTQRNTILGTPNYMAPEQLLGRGADQRSDIFAIGAVLHELLCGLKAFPGNSPATVFQKILNEEPRPIRELCPDLRPEVGAIVKRALMKEPASRYQDLGEMREDLRRARLTVDPKLAELRGPISGTTRRQMADPTVPAAGTPAGTPRRTDRRLLQERRAQQIQQHIEAGRAAFEARDFPTAVEECEAAAVLDPDNATALDLLDRARDAIVEGQVRECLVQARAHLERKDFAAATSMVQRAIDLNPASPAAVAMRDEIREAERAAELQEERAAIIRQAIERAVENLRQSAFEAAIRAANEVLALDSRNQEAAGLKQQAVSAIQARELAEKQARAASEVVDEARRRFARGEHQDAIALLDRFTPRLDIIVAALEDLRARGDEIRRLMEAERQRAARAKAVATQLQRARAAIAESRFAEALDVLAQVAKLDPGAEGVAELMRQARAGQAAAEAKARQVAEAKAREAAEAKAREAAAARAREEEDARARDAAEAAIREAEARARDAQAKARAAARQSTRRTEDAETVITGGRRAGLPADRTHVLGPDVAGPPDVRPSEPGRGATGEGARAGTRPVVPPRKEDTRNEGVGALGRVLMGAGVLTGIAIVAGAIYLFSMQPAPPVARPNAPPAPPATPTTVSQQDANPKPQTPEPPVRQPVRVPVEPAQPSRGTPVGVGMGVVNGQPDVLDKRPAVDAVWLTQQLQSGANAYDQMRYDEAIAAFDAVLARDPRNAAAIDGRARAVKSRVAVLMSSAVQNVDAGDYDAAIRDYENVLRVDPRNAVASKGIENARKWKDAVSRAIKK